MSIKKIQTHDGIKLRNTKTNKLAGSVGKGKEAPKPSPSQLNKISLKCYTKQCRKSKVFNSLFCSQECRLQNDYKMCGKCEKEFLITDFIPRANWCRKCLKIYNKELYAKRIHLSLDKQEKIKESVARHKLLRSLDMRQQHKEWLRSNACCECEERDICVLDADHLDQETKETEVSNLVGRGASIERYLKERSKVRVLCVNCHRIHTHEQKNSWAVNGYLEQLTPEHSIVGSGLSLRERRNENLSKKDVIELCWHCKIELAMRKGRYCSRECLRLARLSKIRYCGNCKKNLPQANFVGRDPKCTRCHKESSDKHYLDNKEYYGNKGAHQKQVRWLINRKKLASYLQLHPCVGIRFDGSPCGESRIEVLEFDHLDGVDKISNITEVVRDWSWPRIEAEIAKCQILCANCHRRRTHKQQGDWASKSECPDHRDEMDDAPPLVRRPRKRDYPKIE